MYVWTGTYSQPADATYTINFNDPTINQLLTQFNAEETGYWAGTYYDNNAVPHTAAFRFTLGGNWTLFDDGQNIGTGTYALVSRDPSSFAVTFTIGDYQGTYYELYGYFVMRNGPPSWPLIEYYYESP